MQITKVEEFIGATVAKEVLKKTMGDSPEFEIVYEALIQSAKSKEVEIEDEVENNEYSYSPAGVGQKLDSLPMMARQEPIEYSPNNTEVKAKDLKWDFQIYKESQNPNVNSINEVEADESSDDKSRIYAAVDKYSSMYGVDKNLVLGIIKQESNFDPNVTSSAGAMGVMQLMDFNCESYGVTDPFNIEQNVEGGVKHIKEYLDMFNGDLEMALMAYNGGPGTMARRGVESSKDLYKMPSETQNYVPKVMNYYRNGVS